MKTKSSPGTPKKLRGCFISGEPGGFALAARAAYPAGTRFLFTEKKPGKEKAERGTSRSPLHSPPKGRPFGGPPILAGYNAFRIGGKPGIGHAMLWKYRRRRMKAGMRFGGVQRGVSPLWAFFPTAFFAKKAVPRPGRTPARRAHPHRGPRSRNAQKNRDLLRSPGHFGEKT